MTCSVRVSRRSHKGQGYIGLLVVLILVAVLSFIEFGGSGGGSSSKGGSAGGVNSLGGGSSSGGQSYGAVINAAKNAAANQSKPDQFSGGNSGLIPTTTTVPVATPAYVTPSRPANVTTQAGWVALAHKVATTAQGLANGAAVAAIDPVVGQSYLQLAYTEVASGVGATLRARGSSWQLSSANGRLNACLSAGVVVNVAGGACT
jgi:hypothetical protein